MAAIDLIAIYRKKKELVGLGVGILSNTRFVQ